MMRRPRFIARQSGNPRGWLGGLIARIMEGETAADNERAVSMLGLQPHERVLDIGTGHGRTLVKIAALLDRGHAVGVDHSAVMCARARRNNAKQIQQGRLQVEQATSDRMPFEASSFDAALSVHTIYFWQPIEPHLREIARVLRPGGRFVLGFRTNDDPRAMQFPASVYKFRAFESVEASLVAAGLRTVQVHRGQPTSTVFIKSEKSG